jgi:outer membrane protein
MRTLLATVVIATLSATVQAQAPVQKIGYANVEYIFSQMPESKQVESELQATNTQLENTLKQKYAEYEQKLKAYQSMPATTPDAIKRDKESELANLEQSIQKFQQDAQSTLQQKQGQLMEPIYSKVGKAIEDVARENGFAFIFNQQVGQIDLLLYNDEQFDVSDLVLKKMGITPKPATATNPPKK